MPKSLKTAEKIPARDVQQVRKGPSFFTEIWKFEFIPKGSWAHPGLHPYIGPLWTESFLWSKRGYLEFMSYFSPCEQTKWFLWVILPTNCQGKVWQEMLCIFIRSEASLNKVAVLCFLSAHVHIRGPHWIPAWMSLCGKLLFPIFLF